MRCFVDFLLLRFPSVVSATDAHFDRLFLMSLRVYIFYLCFIFNQNNDAQGVASERCIAQCVPIIYFWLSACGACFGRIINNKNNDNLVTTNKRKKIVT